MSPNWNRRDVLKGLAVASTAGMVPSMHAAVWNGAESSAQPVEIQITAISAHTFRLSILAVNNGSVGSIHDDGSLVQESWGSPVTRLRAQPSGEIAAGNFHLKISFNPVSITIANEHGEKIQQLDWDESSRQLSFLTGDAPL